MNAVEFAGWRAHLARYPPAESVLASIWILLCQVLGGKNVDPEVMGYWLESPAARALRKELRYKAATRAHVRAAAEAFKAMTKEVNNG